MKWMAEITSPQKMRFEIVTDGQAGYYLYVWENGNGKYDYLQDTLELAKSFALTKFQVPVTAWQEIN